ncbi:MAG: N-acetyltransferase, partial [Bacteroidaceae bacterium]|nr:N-acetyltransferase [Bacteroidaceae bacterium]
LYDDMVSTFTREKNPSFEFCEADYFLACDANGKVVGRVAAIINHRSNEAWETKNVRFGWIDFIDDTEVSKALLDTVAAWGKERGMTTMQGPMGFVDLDAEGLLIEGFDQLSTMATIYNYPYYQAHLEQYGLEKDNDWVEFKINIPDAIPDKMKRIADLISRKYGLHVKKLKDMKEVNEGNYGQKIFNLINDEYSHLYGYSRMSQKQIDQYVNMYLPILDLRMVTLIEDAEDNLVGVGVSMPSLSKALQKAKGKMLPFGWWHLLKALRFNRPKTLDLMLVAVKQEYQNKGVNSLLFTDLIPTYQALGFKDAESNPEMETNNKVQAQWEYFDTTQHKRRRAYKKSI